MNRTLLGILIALIVLVGAGVGFAVYFSVTPHAAGQNLAAYSCTSGTNAAAGTSPDGGPSDGNWTGYHGNTSLPGFAPMSNITGAREHWASPTRLDGPVYAEPLQCGNSLFVATENNTVYSLNASSGSTLWRTSLGTPVLGSTLPCGDIEPKTGITGTPVLDVASETLYVVAFLSPGQHVLFGLNAGSGTVRSHVVVDPSGSEPDVEQERGALALANGYVYVPYGGLAGDCGPYHGWIVGIPTNGSGGPISYQVPTGRAGGIWTPSGLSISAAGDLYVTTGNSDATTNNDYGDTVLELSPSLRVLSYFTPTNWAQLNSNDTDLGSVAPAVLPDGDVFQVGKAGVGYLLSGTDLGGIGGELYQHQVCAGAYAGTAEVGGSLVIACTDGLVRLAIDGHSFSMVWQTTSFDAGAPIVTGNIVWAVDVPSATLLGFNLSTGGQAYSFPLGAAEPFITPSAAPGSVYVAAGDKVLSLALTVAPAP